MFRQIASLLLALLLLQSFCLPLRRHWCGGAVVAIDLVAVNGFGGGHSCCASAKSGTCSLAGATTATPRPMDAAGPPADPTIAQFSSAKCCYDELQQELENVTAQTQESRAAAAPAPVPAPPVCWNLDLALEGWGVAGSLEGGAARVPPPRQDVTLSRNQARAYLQVYLI